MTSLDLDDQLCFAVYAAEHAFSRAYKPLLDPLGLTYPQYLVLMVLWETDDQTVSSIGHRLMLESSTLTPLLKRMESQDLVTRVRDHEDERQVRVRLTAAGRKLAQPARAVPKCMLKMAGVSAETIARLKREIDLVRKNLLAAIDAQEA